MTVPSVAAVRFLTACFYGVLLGVLYGFLRPLRRKMTNFADAIFVFAAAWAWQPKNIEKSLKRKERA